ncbi:VWA domain-containing protein [Sulfuriferula thiophila]|uniref:VWA domain-containing protein n=1 Tax=Sulfuriferula thiophila TaxID=1781211 RepID=UPI000F614567|nr:VWA domain-containing protein [Sulfuriferula thiophila]
MLTLAQPGWLALLPLVAVLALVFWRRRASTGATHDTAQVSLLHPNLDQLAHSEAAAPTNSRLVPGLDLLALSCLVVALAQPQWLGNWIPETPQGREIMLLVDTSKSMSISDFEVHGQPVERLAVLQDLVTRFVTGRQGDRFGLIAFGSSAGTLVPPTFDRELVNSMLRRMQIGIAGDDTALGDAIGLALKQLHQQQRLRPALILFTDGDSTAGDMTPTEAVALARHMAVSIYTVQIGGDLFAAGRPTTATIQVSEPGLAQIAALTGGHYYQADNRKALQQVISDIGQLEKTVVRPARRREVQEWYLLPLLLAGALLSISRLYQLRRMAT